MKDYILASRRPLFDTDKNDRCHLCGHEVWYSYKSHMLTMGETPLQVFCTDCSLKTE